MGMIDTIAIDRMPRQSHWKGRRAAVSFHDDPLHRIEATIVRADDEDPWVWLLWLDDGRVLLSTECQFSPLAVEEDPSSAR